MRRYSVRELREHREHCGSQNIHERTVFLPPPKPHKPRLTALTSGALSLRIQVSLLRWWDTLGLKMSRRKRVWGIHTGKAGAAEDLFTESEVIALGWARVGDISRFGEDRTALKEATAAAYPDMKPGGVPVAAGQLFRFCWEVQVGDYVACTSKRERVIRLGVVKGEYKFASADGSPYPNRRSVDWLHAVPRTRFTQGALYELGSALSFFLLKNYDDEFLRAIEGTLPLAIDAVAESESVQVIAEEVRESTSDYILKRISHELKGHPFAELVADLLRTMGYRTRVSPPGADGGIDIIAHRDELGFEPPIIKVQAKSSTEKVSGPTVTSLIGSMESTERVLFVTLGSFTPQARQTERARSQLRLIDGDQLVELILEHYEELDPRFKAVFPLRQVYVPQPAPDMNGE